MRLAFASLVFLVLLGGTLWFVSGTSGRVENDGTIAYGESGARTFVDPLVEAQAKASSSSESPTRSVKRGGRVAVPVRVTTRNLAGDPVGSISTRVEVEGTPTTAIDVTTDENGVAHAELWLSPPHKKPNDFVLGTLATDGYPKLITRAKLSLEHFGGESVILEMVAEPGATLEGRVVDAEGRPVGGAEVRFGPGGTEFHEHYAGPGGEFEVHVRPNLKELALHARLAGVGASRLRRIDMRRHDPDEPVTLTLVGPKTLEGTVHDTLGFLRTGLPLDVRLPSVPVDAKGDELVPFEATGGLSRALAIVDARGRFRITGLANSTYQLFFGDVELVRDPVRPGGWLLPCAGFTMQVRHDDGGMAPRVYHDPEDLLAAYDVNLMSVTEFGTKGKTLFDKQRVDESGRFYVRAKEAGKLSANFYHWSGESAYVKLPELVLGQHPHIQVELLADWETKVRFQFPPDSDFDILGKSGDDPDRTGTFRITHLESRQVLLHGRLYGDPEYIVVPGQHVCEYIHRHGPDWIAVVDAPAKGVGVAHLVEQKGIESHFLLDVPNDVPLKGLYIKLHSLQHGWTRTPHLKLDRVASGPDAPSNSSVKRFRAHVSAAAGNYTLLIAHQPTGRSVTVPWSGGDLGTISL